MVGVSQEHLGEALGVTFQQIQKYEKGLNRIGAGRLYRIGQILKVPVSFFYEGLPHLNGAIAKNDVAKKADQESTIVMDFLSTPEGYSLSRAFTRIDDAPTRRRLVELVRTIAEADSN
jgi:transcriptional regulator with XRE-family HTH domain